MVSIIKKTIRGKPYYYARECQRIDGKPKIVWQKYLGKADDIIAALTQVPAVANARFGRDHRVWCGGCAV